MTRPKPNAELAYAVLDHIDAHPEQWNQGVWVRIRVRGCGTAACFAGWASLLSGDEPYEHWSSDNGASSEIRSAETGRIRQVRNRARDLLRITDWQADDLFDAGRIRSELDDAVAEIFGPRPDAAS